jgi:hypothetical protein
MLTKLPSASQGFDIPAGMNPLTQLHEQEMVLPKALANPLREMLAAGGGGGLTVNVSAMDTQGVVDALRRGRSEVITEMNEWRRDRRMR